ncbi:hypothetical protein H6P81_012802 [Aristolochia fimbriata]|uniref:Protein kinase domain-containing protein n=1 Tax=Aristolochia fimbriata TaxID=158543 RepID=A0AAV7ED80_ARIFI|nr:hypothetical protein H6P81_012802 [Aristolochia fimbriata]
MASYPTERSAYHLLHKIGAGVSAVVYKAVCLAKGPSSVVAVKSIDLERARVNLNDLRLEAKSMALLSHPNVLTAHCSFTVGTRLWVVMPFMSAGSLHSIISSAFPSGLPEPAIAVVLRHTLHALHYLHSQGHLHRDVKAGNILLHSDGSVKLADFGVSASIYDHPAASTSSTASSSFFCDVAGTPYWMAPEVIDSRNGYGFKADIWSLGITAMELAHGRPPLSHLPPSKSLVMRMSRRLSLDYVDDDGAGDRSRDMNKKKKKKKKFSKQFRDMVASCLVQDPSKRPTAEKLLKHPFFKSYYKSQECNYLVKHVLQGLPSVEDRFKEYYLISAASASHDGHEEEDQEEEEDDDDDIINGASSKNRRISGWNFNEDGLEFDPVFPNIINEKDLELVTQLNPCSSSPSSSAAKMINNNNELSSYPSSCSSSALLNIQADTKEGTNYTIVDAGVLVPSLVSLMCTLELQRQTVKGLLAAAVSDHETTQREEAAHGDGDHVGRGGGEFRGRAGGREQEERRSRGGD